MLWQKVVYPIPPVDISAGTEKVLIAITPASGKPLRLWKIILAALGAGATDPMATWKFGLLSGAAAGGHTSVPSKVDRNVAASIGSSGVDASSAFTGTVPTLSTPQMIIPMFPQWTLNPDDAKDFEYASGDIIGVTANRGSGTATTASGCIIVLEPL